MEMIPVVALLHYPICFMRQQSPQAA